MHAIASSARSRASAVFGLALSGALLDGCGSASDFTETNIVHAIDAKLGETKVCEIFSPVEHDDLETRLGPQVLANIPEAEWKALRAEHDDDDFVHLRGVYDQAWASRESKMQKRAVLEGLTEAGLVVTGRVYEVKSGMVSYPAAVLLPAALPFVTKEPSPSGGKMVRVCYARLHVEKLQRWSTPTGEQAWGRAFFTIAPTLEPSLAKSPSLQTALRNDPDTQGSRGKVFEARIEAMNDGLMATEIRDEGGNRKL